MHKINLYTFIITVILVGLTACSSPTPQQPTFAPTNTNAPVPTAAITADWPPTLTNVPVDTPTIGAATIAPTGTAGINEAHPLFSMWALSDILARRQGHMEVGADGIVYPMPYDRNPETCIIRYDCLYEDHVAAQNQYNDLIWEEAGKMFSVYIPEQKVDFIEISQLEFSRLLKAQIASESQFVADEVSGAGAIGLMGIIPHYSTQQLQIDGWIDNDPDEYLPQENIRVGLLYLLWIYNDLSNQDDENGWQITPAERLELSYAGYNGGPYWIKNVRSQVASTGTNPTWENIKNSPLISNETRSYLEKIYVIYKLSDD